jgi:hypothetical protein
LEQRQARRRHGRKRQELAGVDESSTTDHESTREGYREREELEANSLSS